MKKRHFPIAAAVLGLSLGAWSAAFAAPKTAPQGEPQARTRLRERISDLYLLRLTRALELTEEQTARIYPLLTRAEKQKAVLQRQMSLDLRAIRAELAEPRAGEGAVLELVARVGQARRAIRQKDDEVEALLEGILTPVQRARYLVFTVDFMRTVGENLERARGRRGEMERTP
jgi:Spy/CpxP family protein refolding chaperone